MTMLLYVLGVNTTLGSCRVADVQLPISCPRCSPFIYRPSLQRDSKCRHLN